MLKSLLIILVMFAGMICAMNAVWLRYSSTKVVVGHRGVASVVIRVDGEEIELGNLRTGESRFLLLPRTGKSSKKSTFSISFMSGDMETSVCTLGIDQSGQHVDVVLYHDIESACTLSSPILSELIVTKMF